MSLKPSESFMDIMRFVCFINRCVGADIYQKNYRMNIFTVMSMFVILIYSGFTISTLISESNWIFSLRVMVMTGQLIQGTNKMFVIVTNTKALYELNQSVFVIYKKYEDHPDPRFATDLLTSCRRLNRALIVVGISYVVAISGMIILPLTFNMMTGDRQLIMQFHVPGIDVKTETGLWLTQMSHSFVLIVGAIGMFAGDMVIIVHLLQTYIFSDVLRLKIDGFNKFVDKPGEQPDSEIQELLVDMIEFHQEYIRFLSRCNKLLNSIVSTQVITAAACFVLTLFVLLTTNWPGGYAYAIALIPNLYIYCILGTLLGNCNDDIMYEVYNISFYNLKARHQREVLFMLGKTQRTDMIQLVGIVPLAVSTALQITKTIYSVAMMMVRVLMHK
ncbi:hypothetical protein KR093_005140 [Drosophila rubida]|uniref:Odorant receptor n=1 Tax=Drosophila rubida TaxID=30044 RepID=A0AAD4PR33_9MUSC|nr:hypothetical protein KR093_005140 [Drosophila rubida]